MPRVQFTVFIPAFFRTHIKFFVRNIMLVFFLVTELYWKIFAENLMQKMFGMSEKEKKKTCK